MEQRTGSPASADQETGIGLSRKRREDGPLYLQIASALRDDIIGGRFPIGSLLPTEDDLCARFSVSRHTVREAVRRLREEDLVSSRQGAGTVVAARTSAPLFYSATSIDDLAAYAQGTRVVISTMTIVEIDDIGQAPDAPVPAGSWLRAEAVRVREGEAAPECCTDFYINAKYAAVGRMLQQNTGSLYRLIEDMFGVRVGEVRQEISATLLTARHARILDAKKGSPALEIRRIYCDTEGKIVEISVSVHPAARFRHSSTMQLSR